jgi:hypothetical protein
LIISVTLSFIFFLKSSMIFLCTFLSIFFVFSSFKKEKYFFLPLFFFNYF